MSPINAKVNMELCSILVEYFRIELPQLKSCYQWKIPVINGFEKSGEKGYEANIELKKHLNRKWVSCSNIEERVDISKTIVSDWGGVKNNKRTTLQSYVNEVISKSPSTPLKGVASYSKIFAVADMDKYAIYDARVAVCLNAIQWNYNIKKGVVFNYIPGRNNTTGHAGKKIGFVYQDEFKAKNLLKKGWAKVKGDETYTIYLKTLKECLKYLEKYQLHDLEMVLFANAEKECKTATESLSRA